MLNTRGGNRPELGDVPPNIVAYIRELEDATMRAGFWTPERWIALSSFAAAIIATVFAVGARWNGVDALEQRMSKIETRVEASASQSETIYMRRDLSEERFQVISHQLSELQADVKTIKSFVK